MRNVAKGYPERNSESLVSFWATNRYGQAMDARSTRIANLRALVKELGIDAVAAAAQTSNKTLAQVLAGTPLPSGKPRGVGHNLARRLEAACHKPHGWLDTPHDDTLPEPAATLIDYIRTAAIGGALSAEQARALYDVTRAMINTH